MLARTWASDYRSRRLKKWVGLVAVRSGVRAATRLTRPIGPRPGVVTASTKKIRKNFCKYSEYSYYYPQSMGGFRIGRRARPRLRRTVAPRLAVRRGEAVRRRRSALHRNHSSCSNFAAVQPNRQLDQRAQELSGSEIAQGLSVRRCPRWPPASPKTAIARTIIIDPAKNRCLIRPGLCNDMVQILVCQSIGRDCADFASGSSAPRPKLVLHRSILLPRTSEAKGHWQPL